MSLDLRKNLVLAAGAGTGKTHALVSLAVGAYFGDGQAEPLDPRRVWAVTFTDKAAEELRSRITQRVRARVAEEPGGVWEGVLDALPDAPIGTFHSLALRLIREYAFEAGVDPRARILDESRDRELRTAVLERWVASAIDDPSSRALAVARRLGGAWDLRWAVDTLHRKLGEEGLHPHELLSRAEESARFDPRVAEHHVDAALEAVRRALGPVEKSEAPRLQAVRDMLVVEKERIAGGGLDGAGKWYPALVRVVRSPRGRGALPKDARAAWKPFAEAWQALEGAWAAWAEAAVGRDLVELVAAFDAEYAANKTRLGVLSFVDLVRGARDLLRRDPQVRAEVKSRVGALLVDEFQDTNAVQIELVRLLAERRDENRSYDAGQPLRGLALETGVLGAVGDRKQSIYEFRGADVGLFAALIDEAKQEEGFRFEVQRRSYRAHAGLVGPINSIFGALFGDASSSETFAVSWREDEDALEAVRDSGPSVGVERLRVEGSTPRHPDRELEARALARYIDGLLRQTSEWQPADIAILVRSHAQIEAHVDALRELGHRCRVLGGRGLLARRAVRDAVALLATIADPSDPVACAALLRGPLGVSDDAFTRLVLADRATAAALATCELDELALAEDERHALARWLAAVEQLRDGFDRLGAGLVFDQAAEQVGLRSAIAEGPNPGLALDELVAFRGLLTERDPVSARAWVRTLLVRGEDPLDRVAPPEPGEGDLDAVRVMTVHASKGLEFPVVCVPELGAEEPGEGGSVGFERDLGLAVRLVDPRGKRVSSPRGRDIFSRASARRRAESTRLLYVAMTRARERLVLVGEGRKDTWAARLDAVCEGVPGVVEVALDPNEAIGERTRRRAAKGRQLPLLPHNFVAAPAAAAPTLFGSDGVPRKASSPQLVAGVTSLAELQRCPRRYFHRVVAGLDEFAPSESLTPSERASDLDPLEVGTLAHTLLERVDLQHAAAEPQAALDEVARLGSVDAGAFEEVAQDVLGFLLSDEGQGVLHAHAADPRRVLRELPFALLVEADDASLLVRGQIDLLWIDDTGAVRVIDYKHARAPKVAEAYAFQLRTYALAARRLWGPEAGLSAGLAWLRERGDPVRVREVDSDELEAHTRGLRSVLERLVELETSQEPWPRLARPRDCGECGFRARCWPQ